MVWFPSYELSLMSVPCVDSKGSLLADNVLTDVLSVFFVPFLYFA